MKQHVVTKYNHSEHITIERLVTNHLASELHLPPCHHGEFIRHWSERDEQLTTDSTLSSVSHLSQTHQLG